MKGLILIFLLNQKNFEFSHKKHLERYIDCITCHEKASQSELQSDDLLPGHKECSSCHNVDESCSNCHIREPKKIRRITLYISKFSHKKHSSINCLLCHKKIKEEEFFLSMGLASYPKMEFCIECHKDKKIKSTCETCHTDREEKLYIYHPKGYTNLHSREARLMEKNCAFCHDNNFESFIGKVEIPACNTCHAKENIKFKNHPENYKFIHSFSYYSKESNCVSCHINFNDCVGCHKKEKIYPIDHNSIDWVKKDGGIHKTEAISNPERCIVCHEEKDNVCLTCH
ncbi:MAG: hypothetical protein ABDH37_04950 [Candidatus Hydrothermales bacterium]